MTLRLLRWSALTVIAGIILPGCGSPEGAANQLPTYKITARATVDGKPLGGLQLTMTPVKVDSGLPNSGAMLAADGTGQFSTYSPTDGIPAGEYKPGLLPDMLTMKPVPQVKPLTVTTTKEMDGGELKIDFESTGKTQQSPLPRMR